MDDRASPHEALQFDNTFSDAAATAPRRHPAEQTRRLRRTRGGHEEEDKNKEKDKDEEEDKNEDDKEDDKDNDEENVRDRRYGTSRPLSIYFLRVYISCFIWMHILLFI